MHGHGRGGPPAAQQSAAWLLGWGSVLRNDGVRTRLAIDRQDFTFPTGTQRAFERRVRDDDERLPQLQKSVNMPFNRGPRRYASYRHLCVACEAPGFPGLVDEARDAALRELVQCPLGCFPPGGRAEEDGAGGACHDPLIGVHHTPRDPHIERTRVRCKGRREPVHRRRVWQRLPGRQLPADVQRPQLGHGRLTAPVVRLDQGAPYGPVGVPLQRFRDRLDGGAQVADRGKFQLCPPR